MLCLSSVTDTKADMRKDSKMATEIKFFNPRTDKINSYVSLYNAYFDEMPSNRAKRSAAYDAGFEIGQNAIEFHIGMSGAWSTWNRDDSHTSAYEVLGYHCNTCYFFAGVYASGVKIIDHRIGNEGIYQNVI